MKVLVLEDAVSPVADALVPRLEADGHRVVRAPDERGVFDATRPDAVLDVREIPVATRESGVSLAVFARLVEVCSGARTHLVFLSSSAVYGASDQLPFGVEQLLERQLSVFGAAHRSRELLAQAAAHEHGLPATALRVFELYGPAVPGFVADVIAAARAGQPIELPGSASTRHDFVFLDDVVEVLVRAAERAPDPIEGIGPFAAHNVGSGNPTPLSRVAELVGEALGRSIATRDASARAGAMPNSWADVRELQQAYGFRPRTPLKDGLVRTIAAKKS